MCAVIGFFILGIVFGAVAIVVGYRARNEIRNEPLRFKGDGLARAGIVLGVVDVVINVVFAIGAFGAS